MAVLHIYTSSKGGVGKTLQALCTSLRYLKTEHHVLICDFNTFNADLRQIFKSLEDRNQSPINRGGLAFRPLVQEGSYIISPIELYKLPGNGIMGFFELVKTVFTFAAEQKRHPDAIIIDTGYHLANFDVKDRTEAVQLPPMARTYDPYFWFIWTVAALRRQDEMAAIRQTVRALLSQDLGWGEFSEVRHLIHVMNPHAIVPIYFWNIVKSFIRYGTDISIVAGFDKVADFKKLHDGIPLQFIESKIHRSFEEAVGGRAVAGQLTRGEQLEQIMTPFIELNARPRNLLVLPYFVKSLTTYTDLFSLKAGMKLDDLIESLQPIYEVVNNFLMDLHR